MPTQNLLSLAPNCPNCGAPLDYAGPLWLGQLFDFGFCERMLTIAPQLHLHTEKRIVTLLQLILAEAHGPITYHNIHRICHQYKLNSIPIAKILQELQNQGEFASRTHFSQVSIRTSAARPQIAEKIQEINIQN